MFDALRTHWRDYLLEGAGLMAFMLGAGAFATLFMYPGSPVAEAITSDFGKRAGIGLFMGLVTFTIVSIIGMKSGAHINPAVTWAFWRQGKIGGWDAIFYTAAQFAGAILAPIILFAVIGTPFAHEEVKYATSQPGPEGLGAAFAAEFVISFVLMLVILVVLDSRRLAKRLPVIVGVMIAVYIAFESQISGMSMNPARSFGSALTAGKWTAMWIYFAAPVLAMLLAVEVHRLLQAALRRTDAPQGETSPHYPIGRKEPNHG